jgi:regulator of ribosome biosynthesis
MTDLTMTSIDDLNPTSKNPPPSHLVVKPTPYTYSLSHLTAIDPNPLPQTSHLLSLLRPELNSTLQSIARDGTQSLITTLLTTTTIHSTSDGLNMTLPPPATPLPRWKPLPKPKAPTKWETFAKKKGIGKFAGSASGGAALAERRKNAVYDEEKGEWVKKWGYKGRNKGPEGEWLVEVDEKQRKGEEDGKSVRGEGKRERMERVRRQVRKERNNERRGRRGAG